MGWEAQKKKKKRRRRLGLPLLSVGCQAELIHAIKRRNQLHGHFSDGHRLLLLLLLPPRSPASPQHVPGCLWRWSECGLAVLSRSVAARFSDSCPHKITAARQRGTRTSPSLSCAFVGSLNVRRRPDNSRIPARLAAQQQERPPPPRPDPGQAPWNTRPTKLRTNWRPPFRVLLRKSHRAGAVFTHTWLVMNGSLQHGHAGDPAEEGRRQWFVNIKDSASGSKRAVLFKEDTAPVCDRVRFCLPGWFVVLRRERCVLSATG